jgi:hypothetical protein
MSLRSLPAQKKMGGFHFVPQAVVNQPPEFFASKGAKFHEGHDDFDEYVVSELSLGARFSFALLRYNGTPEGQTTVFLQDHVPLPEIAPTVAEILDAFGLSDSALAWIRKRLDTPY